MTQQKLRVGALWEAYGRLVAALWEPKGTTIVWRDVDPKYTILPQFLGFVTQSILTIIPGSFGHDTTEVPRFVTQHILYYHTSGSFWTFIFYTNILLGL